MRRLKVARFKVGEEPQFEPSRANTGMPLAPPRPGGARMRAMVKEAAQVGDFARAFAEVIPAASEVAIWGDCGDGFPFLRADFVINSRKYSSVLSADDIERFGGAFAGKRAASKIHEFVLRAERERSDWAGAQLRAEAWGWWPERTAIAGPSMLNGAASRLPRGSEFAVPSGG